MFLHALVDQVYAQKQATRGHSVKNEELVSNGEVEPISISSWSLWRVRSWILFVSLQLVLDNLSISL